MIKSFDKKHITRTLYIIFVISLLVIVYYFTIGFSLNKSGSYFNNKKNAIWIGHKWVGEFHSDNEIKDLVKSFQEHDIKTVYVHTGPFLKNGSIDDKLNTQAVDFISKAKSFDKNIEYQAWLGQIRSKIDLSSQQVRNNITSTALLLTSNIIGFDGIHYDIEPIHDEDTDFIKLLKETRNKLPSDKKISVAISELIPSSIMWMLENVRDFNNFNSEKNFKNISKFADQIVVMVYDTGMPKPWLYKWLVSEQVIRLSNLINGPELLIALPTYNYISADFDPNIENIKTGLTGVISGLNNLRSNNDNFTGIAIYMNSETDALEWNIYKKLFQK